MEALSNLPQITEILKGQKANSKQGTIRPQTEMTGHPYRALMLSLVRALFFIVFISTDLCLAVLGLLCYTGFSVVVASGGYSPVAAHRLLTVAACLVEQGL